MTMSAQPNPMPRETAVTAGVSNLRTPGAFLRRFLNPAEETQAPPEPPKGLFADQQWLVTYERPNGDIVTEAVMINGGNLQVDIETLAQMALLSQRDVECATIIRISLDLRSTPARVELLEQISRKFSNRMQFEQESG